LVIVTAKSPEPELGDVGGRLDGAVKRYDSRKVVGLSVCFPGSQACFLGEAMTIRNAMLVAIVLASSSPAMTALASQGTPKEQAACRSDVRRYCSAVKAHSDSGAFLSCLQAHRSKLSKSCLSVLVSHGQ
jgi:hypothetical protein